jgi:hypothetical protein
VGKRAGAETPGANCAATFATACSLVAPLSGLMKSHWSALGQGRRSQFPSGDQTGFAKRPGPAKAMRGW